MRLRESSILAVDLIGSVVVCVLLAAGIWHVFLRPSTASAETRELRMTLAGRTRDLATLEHEFEQQKVLLEQRKERLAATGTPPARTAIEDDLRTIVELARRNDLHLAEVSPLGSAWYPGVSEIRYRVAGSGTYRNITKLLHQFEGCDFWGDITYVQIGRPKSPAGPQTHEREMSLTVSFYSTESLPDTKGQQATGP